MNVVLVRTVLFLSISIAVSVASKATTFTLPDRPLFATTCPAPWALKKADPARMAAVLGTLVVAIRELAVAVSPVVPGSAAKIIALIDSGEGGQPIAQPMPIFPRLELPEVEAA